MLNRVASRTARRFRDERVLRGLGVGGLVGQARRLADDKDGVCKSRGRGFPRLRSPLCFFPARCLSLDQDKPAGQRDVTRAGKGPWWG